MADAEVLKVEPIFGGDPTKGELAKTEAEIKAEEEVKATEVAKEVTETVADVAPPKEFVAPKEIPPATAALKPMTELQLELHKKLEAAMAGRLESEIPLKDDYWTIRNEVLLAR